MEFSEEDWRLEWRNAHYIDDLNRILDERRPNDFTLKPNPRLVAVICREQQIHDSPVLLSSTSNQPDSLDSSTTSGMSWESTGSVYTAGVSSHSTSPTTLSQASISPITPDSSNSSTSPNVCCRDCCIEFKGSPQDASSNYQRHLRTSPKHKTNAGLKCPRPECRMKAPKRSDNLGPHLLNFHKIKSSSERQRIIETCRSSAVRVESDGVPRRGPRRA